MLSTSYTLSYTPALETGELGTGTASVVWEKLSNDETSATYVSTPVDTRLPRHSLTITNKSGVPTSASYGTDRVDVKYHRQFAATTPSNSIAVAPWKCNVSHSRPKGLTPQQWRNELEAFRAFVNSELFADLMNFEV